MFHFQLPFILKYQVVPFLVIYPTTWRTRNNSRAIKGNQPFHIRPWKNFFLINWNRKCSARGGNHLLNSCFLLPLVVIKSVFILQRFSMRRQSTTREIPTRFFIHRRMFFCLIYDIADHKKTFLLPANKWNINELQQRSLSIRTRLKEMKRTRSASLLDHPFPTSRIHSDNRFSSSSVPDWVSFK